MKAGRAVIFDLDQTLVDSRATEALRKKRKWNDVLTKIGDCPPYEGIVAAWSTLRDAGVKLGVVTNSPSKYADAVLRMWGLVPDALVCYHDTRQHKPDPEPMLLCAHRLGVDVASTVCVGDSSDDILAGRAAGCRTVGATWGAVDVAALGAARPQALCASPIELGATLERMWRAGNQSTHTQ